MRQMIAATIGALCLATGASAAEPETCRDIRFSDLGDNQTVAITSAVAVVMEALGYRPEALPLPLDETIAKLASGEIDVFLVSDASRLADEIERHSQAGDIGNIGRQGGLENLPWQGPPDSVGALPPAGKSSSGEPSEGDEVTAAITAPQAGDGAQTGGADGDDRAGAPHDRFLKLVRGGYTSECPNAAALLGNIEYDVPKKRLRADQDGHVPLGAAVRVNRMGVR